MACGTLTSARTRATGAGARYKSPACSLLEAALFVRGPRADVTAGAASHLNESARLVSLIHLGVGHPYTRSTLRYVLTAAGGSTSFPN